MKTLKGGWVGQTFALAKCNESDSGVRKSRIRRSKEERKAMIESFVQKYQKQNSGNFPSLNLTHKEVGGSFYTVREIVREIIQENRVLGPAKFAPEEEYPLGSIAIEPQSPLPLATDGLDPYFKHSLVQGSCKEVEVITNGYYNGSEEASVKDALINGSQTDFGNEESEVAAHTGLRVVENVVTGVVVDDSVSETSTSAIINLTSLEVETFPLKADDCLNGTLGELRDAPGTMKEKHINEETSRTASSESEEKISLLDDEKDSNPVSSLVGETYTAGSVEEVVSPPIRSPDSSTASEGGTVHDVDNGATAKNKVLIDVSISKDLEEINNIAWIQAQNVPNGIHSGSCENPGSQKSLARIESKPEADTQISNGTVVKVSNPTLNRINLESWEVSSKNTLRSELNPLLAILKGFVASFVKFWSE